MSESPRRVQLSRRKGWRMPPNTVKVSRPTKWGNPHKVGVSLVGNHDGSLRHMTATDAVAAYRDEVMPYWTDGRRGTHRLNLRELRDVLLELANAAASPTPREGR